VKITKRFTQLRENIVVGGPDLQSPPKPQGSSPPKSDSGKERAPHSASRTIKVKASSVHSESSPLDVPPSSPSTTGAEPTAAVRFAGDTNTQPKRRVARKQTGVWSVEEAPSPASVVKFARDTNTQPKRRVARKQTGVWSTDGADATDMERKPAEPAQIGTLPVETAPHIPSQEELHCTAPGERSQPDSRGPMGPGYRQPKNVQKSTVAYGRKWDEQTIFEFSLGWPGSEVLICEDRVGLIADCTASSNGESSSRHASASALLVWEGASAGNYRFWVEAAVNPTPIPVEARLSIRGTGQRAGGTVKGRLKLDRQRIVAGEQTLLFELMCSSSGKWELFKIRSHDRVLVASV
jgi:hypothetical protein